MNVPQTELNTLRSLSARLKQTVSLARRATLAEERNSLLDEAGHLAANLETRLEHAGAERPSAIPQASSVPLNLLDTPKNRRYAQKLREAWEAGLAVDVERYGPQIGTDGCAQVIEMVLAEVEEECFGAVGKE